MDFIPKERSATYLRDLGILSNIIQSNAEILTDGNFEVNLSQLSVPIGMGTC